MSMQKALTAAMLCVAMITITGCASPARVGGMVADGEIVGTASDTHALHEAIALAEVNGGDETNPMWTSEIGASQFREALRQSLDHAGLLAPTLSAASCRLEADLLDVDQPLFGLDLSVYMTARYMITDGAGSLVYNKTINSVGTATFGDAFSGITRLRIANERAAKDSIKQFIQDLLAHEKGSIVLMERHR